MKHLTLFENFSRNQGLNEASIPVYNEENFRRNINAGPEIEIPFSKVIPKIQELLSQQESGIISSIQVIAEVPTQGKNAPSYVKDVMDQERERIIRKHKEEMGKEIDQDLDMEEFDFDVDRFGNQRTVFFDSEFIVDSVERIGDEEFIIGIPVSLKQRGYRVKISPIKVDEIHYTPA
jgi:hypothetical protein